MTMAGSLSTSSSPYRLGVISLGCRVYPILSFLIFHFLTLQFPVEFPREPTGLMRQHIANEADARLAFYLPLPPAQDLPPGIDVPPRPQLPDDVIDAPLVRVFNFLRESCFHFREMKKLLTTEPEMMSMSYQLEILWYQVSTVGPPPLAHLLTCIRHHLFFQAQRMRSLGWADYLKVEMTNERKTLIVSYWVYVLVLFIPTGTI